MTGRKSARSNPASSFSGATSCTAIGRTKQGKVFEIASDDLGKSWGPMTLTALPNPNSGTDAVTLKDGRHLLVYNHTSKGRSPLNVAVSADGKTMSSVTALVLENGARRVFLSRCHPNVGWPRACHLHLEKTAHQTCHHRSGKADPAPDRRWRMAPVTATCS